MDFNDFGAWQKPLYKEATGHSKQYPKNDIPGPPHDPDLHQVLDGVQVLCFGAWVLRCFQVACRIGKSWGAKPVLVGHWSLIKKIVTNGFNGFNGSQILCWWELEMIQFDVLQNELSTLLVAMKNDEKWWKKRRCTHRMVHSWEKNRLISDFVRKLHIPNLSAGWVFKGLG